MVAFAEVQLRSSGGLPRPASGAQDVDTIYDYLKIADILRGKRKTFGNLAGHVRGMENVNSLAQWTASQFDPALSWSSWMALSSIAANAGAQVVPINRRHIAACCPRI